MAFNILIVDDSSTTRMMISRSLQLARVPVGTLTEAADGEAALALLQESWVDVVIADINMPVMNGIEMMQRMKADEELKSIPIIVISTEGSSERIESLQALGVSAYVRKPFTPEAVRDTFRKVMGDWNDARTQDAA